jgi:predicted transcriptional regulator of viral defense system
MNINKLAGYVADSPIFNAEMLRVGKADPRSVNVQLSRWTKAGKIIQLRRGLYLMNSPYTKLPSGYDLYIAGALHSPSYISLQKALEYHGLIPEGVPVYTCVTTRRPVTVRNPVGEFRYRHIRQGMFWGYEKAETAAGEFFVAGPEKALLDLFYLDGVKISGAYLEELRLQNLGALDLDRLGVFAQKTGGAGLIKAAVKLAAYVKSRAGEGKYL